MDRALKERLRECVEFRVDGIAFDDGSGVIEREDALVSGTLSRPEVPARAWMRLDISLDTLRFSPAGISLLSVGMPFG